LRARIPATGPLNGQQEFIFAAADAVPVTESPAPHGSRTTDHERR
jgi:hypothetical protein